MHYNQCKLFNLLLASFRNLKTLTLPYPFFLQSAIMVLKGSQISSQKINNNKNSTRNILKLHVNHSKSTLAENVTRNLSVNIFNKFSQGITSIEDITTFKIKLKNHLLLKSLWAGWVFGRRNYQNWQPHCKGIRHQWANFK